MTTATPPSPLPCGQPFTTTARNIAAIDAANMGLDFIARYVSPLTTAIASLADDNQDVTALCAVLQQEADNVHAILVCMRDSAGHDDTE